MEWTIRKYDRNLDLRLFCCGKPLLDNFLATLVGQYEKRNLARTYLATQPDDTRVVGYYSLSSGNLEFQKLPARIARKLPRHPIPVALLGRLAVDQSVKGQGLGRLLLGDALQRSRRISEQVGIAAVFVEAIDDESIAFYRHFGFEQLAGQPRQLLLPLNRIESASSSS